MMLNQMSYGVRDIIRLMLYFFELAISSFVKVNWKITTPKIFIASILITEEIIM